MSTSKPTIAALAAAAAAARRSQGKATFDLLSYLGPLRPLVQGVLESTVLAVRVFPVLIKCDFEAWDAVIKVLLANVVIVFARNETYGKGWERWKSPSLLPWVSGSLVLWLLCYFGKVTGWYQAIADALYRHARGIPPGTALTNKPKDNGATCFFLWLFLFLQAMLLSLGVPFTDSLVRVLPSKAVPAVIATTDLAVWTFGHVISAFLYGWYAFEPFQISQGMPLDDRVKALEESWLFLVGFGLPFEIVSMYCSHFANLVFFLNVFPFLVALGTFVDPRAAYRDIKTPTLLAWLVKPAPIFYFAKSATTGLLSILHFAGSKRKNKKKAE